MSALATFAAQAAAEAPVAGAVLQAFGEPLAYVTRKSAINQADNWNSVMAAHLPAGYAVGIGDRVNGRYPLVWVETTSVSA